MMVNDFCRGILSLNVDTRVKGKLSCCPVNHTGANPKNNAVAIIPARFASSRLPGKPLLEIAGKPLIIWVAERAMAATCVSRVLVATDDERVLSAVHRFGYEAVMTSPNHESGTDRLAEVAARMPDAQIIINVQGDEPLIASDTIDRTVAALTDDDECSISTTWEPFTSAADVISPDVVKVVFDPSHRAIYFSRAPIPYPREAVRKHGSIEAALKAEPMLINRFCKHTGLYVYRREALLEFASWPPSELEVAESLEQLRALDHGLKIKVVQSTQSSVGVDTPEDLERVRTVIERLESWVTT
jgi:3-deoxy-manno-octulosonate cytidylyltransferase (CMP-KDO synthetase)